jgi:hypothetical protein
LDCELEDPCNRANEPGWLIPWRTCQQTSTDRRMSCHGYIVIVLQHCKMCSDFYPSFRLLWVHGPLVIKAINQKKNVIVLLTFCPTVWIEYACTQSIYLINTDWGPLFQA